MRNKTLLSSLILGLLILAIGITACGRTSLPGDQEFTIPHDVGWGFTNCLVCHTGGDTAINLDLAFHQINPTNEDCLIPGCHTEGITTIGDGKYTTPHELTGYYVDCLLCHNSDPDNPLGFKADLFHPAGLINEICATPACHPQSSPTPTI
ncbi:MAG: hypothetical protein MUO92_02130, partial [Dehalococcoidales bacterium]|nr:hypothetical protein [Dehalococcoidales bacterium]